MTKTGIQMLITCVAFAGALSCSSDPLKAAKQQAKAAYQKQDPSLLAPIVVKELNLGTRSGPAEKIQMDGGVLTIPKPDSAKEPKPGKKDFTCGAITVKVTTSALKPSFKSLPPSWGSDDFGIIFFLAPTSERDIDSATTREQLQDAIVRLTAKATVMPIGARKGLAKVDSATFTGTLSGDFDAFGGAELLLRPKAQNREVYYRIGFKKVGEVKPGEFKALLDGLSFSPDASSSE